MTRNYGLEFYKRTLISFLLLLCCCSSSTEPKKTDPDDPDPVIEKAYTFTLPDTVIDLPDRLKEISGLTTLDNSQLGAVHDEMGNFYIINIVTGNIDKKTVGEAGDFEGIANIDTTIFILRSNGTLLKISNWKTETFTPEVIETPLKAKNNCEGLAFDSTRNRLLIACKEEPGNGLQDVRAIYAYDLTQNRFVDAPVYTIPLTRDGAALPDFRPSSLAIHPVTGKLFILSSKEKSVLVLDNDNTILAQYTLPDSLYERPEGITFLDNGDMFISNEKGFTDSATLVRLNYKENMTPPEE
ncbi:MAG TPA: SdiA-regulated domain-containing protein [bacterium]|nr:SdiA-regulated domain-containing protein [bacterium]HPN44236.1 SdiA-regulated domain-containing protein [bacterium]